MEIKFNPPAMVQSGNLYGYTMNNPLRYIDPRGLCGDVHPLFTQVGTSGPILHYFFGSHQRAHALRNIEFLSERFQVFYAYVMNSYAFAAAWNALPDVVDIFVVNVHAAPTWTEYFIVSDLSHRTIDTFVFLGCNAGHLNVPDNLANQFLANHTITQLVAVDGYHLRGLGPLTGITTSSRYSKEDWFYSYASTRTDPRTGHQRPRHHRGFMLHSNGQVRSIGQTFVSVNHLLTRIGR